MDKDEARRRIRRSLAVLVLAALASGYLLGWLSTLALGTPTVADETNMTSEPSDPKTMIVASEGMMLRVGTRPGAATAARLIDGATVTIPEVPIVQDDFAWYRLLGPARWISMNP